MLNLSLYLIADPASCQRGEFLSIVEKAILGGVTMVQFRYKNVPFNEFLTLGLQLRKLTKKHETPLIINDSLAIVHSLNADGIHVGQKDTPTRTLRKILGKKKIIGVSVKTISQAKKAEVEGADYLGVGPIFATQSKKDAGGPIGLAMLAKIKESVSIPVVGIGGITVGNAASVLQAGAQGIAVISAIMGAGNPGREARELRRLISKEDG
jgi:thiamine-phosphate diphosphorylase